MDGAIPIIANPAARSAKAAARQEQLRRLTPAAEIHTTKGVGDATKIAERLAREGHRLIVAAGGDGTVNEVLQGLCKVNAERPNVEDHAALGVLPMGTMNVFSLELGVNSADLASCWTAITSGRRRDVDLWKANEQYFVQLAGVGFDAQVVQLTTWEMKKKLGPLSYVISSLKAWFQKKPVLIVHIDGKPPVPASVVFVGSGVHYGGPFRLFRTARNDDGLLDVLIFHQLGYWEIAQMLRAVLIDGYEKSLDLDYFQVRGLRVECAERPVPFQLDGELCGESPVDFRPAGFPLRVAV